MIYRLYTIVLASLLLGYLPVAVYRWLTRGVPLNLRERLARKAASVAGPSAWVHAVSVGEALAVASLVDGLRRMYPDLPVVMTTVTETGARIVRDHFAGVATHRFFPLDLPGPIRRLVRAIHPAFLICMETELWPNTFRALARRRVPVMIVNGRLSDRSFRRYRLVKPLLRPPLYDVGGFALPSQGEAGRGIA